MICAKLADSKLAHWSVWASTMGFTIMRLCFDCLLLCNCFCYNSRNIERQKLDQQKQATPPPQASPWGWWGWGGASRRHYDEQLCSGEVGKMKGQSSACTVERGRPEDMTWRHGDSSERELASPWNRLLPDADAVGGVSWSSLELTQMLPGYWSALTLGHDGGPDGEWLTSRLDLLGGPLWSTMPLSTMCQSVIQTCPESWLMSMAHVTTQGHLEICCLCYSLKPCWHLWAVVLLGATLLWVAWAATLKLW